MAGTIVNLQQLLTLPAAGLAARYGLKTAGVVRLMAAQEAAPLPYRVPAGLAIAADHREGPSASELRAAFDALTQGAGEHGVLMARSSSPREAPGQNPTLFAGYERRSIERGFKRFQDAVQEVRESAPDMGVLLMPLVHGEALQLEGETVLGASNASFVADSHHPLVPDELFIAMVTGLGTRAVDANDDFIPITAERATGRITSIVNKTDCEIIAYSGSVASVLRLTGDEYRQRLLDAFVLGHDGVRTFSLKALEPLLGFEVANRPWLMMENGALRAFDFTGSAGSNLSVPEGMQYLGVTPLEAAESLPHLIGAMRYLAGLSPAPFQIEGAFLPGSPELPVLYQYIELPPVQQSDETLELHGAALASSQVIGTCDFRGPLVVCNRTYIAPTDTEAATRLEFFDKLHAATGYALLAEHHSSQLLALTPGCTIRLSRSSENLSSHAVTFTRSQIAQKRGTQQVLAFNVATDPDSPWSPLARNPRQAFFNTRARIRSNGRQLRVDLDSTDDPRR